MTTRFELAQLGQPIRFTSMLAARLHELVERNIPPGERALAAISLTAKIKAVQAHLGKLRPGAARARSIHKMIDAAMAKSDRKNPRDAAHVSCRQGCSHCCHMFATCTDDERDLLLEVIDAKGLTVDMRRLRLQKERDEDGYMELSYEDAGCVLLGEKGECRVYEDRPSACRLLRVVTPPAHCVPQANLPAAMLCVEPGEIISSGSMNLDPPTENKVASIATKLWRHFETRAQRGDPRQAQTGDGDERPKARG